MSQETTVTLPACLHGLEHLAHRLAHPPSGALVGLVAAVVFAFSIAISKGCSWAFAHDIRIIPYMVYPGMLH